MDKKLLDMAVKENPVVKYMVQKKLPLNRETFVDLNTPGLDPDNLPAELEDEVPDIFRKDMSEDDEEGPNAMEEIDHILATEGKQAAVEWVKKTFNLKK